jgi:hypothetical protein
MDDLSYKNEDETKREKLPCGWMARVGQCTDVSIEISKEQTKR